MDYSQTVVALSEVVGRFVVESSRYSSAVVVVVVVVVAAGKLAEPWVVDCGRWIQRSL